MTKSVTSVTLNIALYIHVYELAAMRAYSQAICLGNNAKIIIILLGYT